MKQPLLAVGGALVVVLLPFGLGIASGSPPGGMVAADVTVTETATVPVTETATVSETATATETIVPPPVTETATATVIPPPVTETATATMSETRTATATTTAHSTATKTATSVVTRTITTTHLVPGPTTRITLPGGQVIVSVAPSVTATATTTLTTTPDPLAGIAVGNTVALSTDSAWSYWPYALAIVVLFAIAAAIVGYRNRTPSRHR